MAKSMTFASAPAKDGQSPNWICKSDFNICSLQWSLSSHSKSRHSSNTFELDATVCSLFQIPNCSEWKKEKCFSGKPLHASRFFEVRIKRLILQQFKMQICKLIHKILWTKFDQLCSFQLADCVRSCTCWMFARVLKALRPFLWFDLNLHWLFCDSSSVWTKAPAQEACVQANHKNIQ